MSVWSNRIIIVLSALGLFITGVLSYTTYNQLEPPCGGHIGCSAVQQSPFSKFPISTGVSVSYLGLIGYVLLFGLALVRASVVGKLNRKLAWFGFVGTAIGTVFSLYLTYTALAIVQQKCVWCLASLAVIIVSTIAHAALLQADPPEKSDVPLSFGIAAVLLIGLLGTGFLTVQNLTAQIDLANPFIDPNAVTLEELVPIDEKTIGGKDAKVTLVEFADINCGTCRANYPQIKQTLRKHGDGVRLAFRHFPLIGTEGHSTSAAAAAIAEYAADKGMFWKYMDEVMNDRNTERIKTLDGLISVAGESGLNKGDILTIFRSEKPEHKAMAEVYWKRVDADLSLGMKMSVASTPTFILYAEGQKAKPVAGRNIDGVLGEAPYRELIQRK